MTVLIIPSVRRPTDAVRINSVGADTVLAMVEGILPDEKKVPAFGNPYGQVRADLQPDLGVEQQARPLGACRYSARASGFYLRDSLKG